ncbi:MAG TPA: tetratricopeptide repeat protein, partial [Flavisolibacter sp.]
MREKILLGIIFFLLSPSLVAQQHLVDSIKAELGKPMADSNRALSMMRLAIDYEVLDTAKAFRAYEDAIHFANDKKLYYQLGRIYQNQSFLFSTTGNYSRAVESLDKAIENYQRSGHAKARLWEANAYNDKANILKTQNEFQQAVDYYMKAISLMEEMKLYDKLTNSYSNLANIFGDLAEAEKENEYALKAVEMAKKSGSRQHIFIAYFILTNARVKIPDVAGSKRFLDSARAYFNEEENVDNIDILFSFYLVSAQVFRVANELDSAFYFFKKSYDLSTTYNYGYGKAESQLQMGAVSLLQKHYPEAERFLLSGIADAKAISYFGM